MYGAKNSVRSQPSDLSIGRGHLVVCNQWLVWFAGSRVVLLMWLGPCWICLRPSASPCSPRAELHGFSREVIRHLLWWLASLTMSIPRGVASLLIPDPETSAGSLPPYYIQLLTEIKTTERNIYSASQRRRANDSVAIISLPHLPNSAWSGSCTSIMLNSYNCSHSLLFKASMPLYLLVLCIWASFTFLLLAHFIKFQFRHHLLLPDIPK